jgi:hypothetical protein
MGCHQSGFDSPAAVTLDVGSTLKASGCQQQTHRAGSQQRSSKLLFHGTRIPSVRCNVHGSCQASAICAHSLGCCLVCHIVKYIPVPGKVVTQRHTKTPRAPTHLGAVGMSTHESVHVEDLHVSSQTKEKQLMVIQR